MTLLIDASALQSEHRRRGVGVYLRALVEAIEGLDAGQLGAGEWANRPRYLTSTLGGPTDLPPERTTRVYRPHRPAQMYWMYNELAMRAVLARVRPRVFFAPDFNGLVHNPYGRTVSVLYDLTHLKLTDLPNPDKIKAQGLSERLDRLRWRVYEYKLRRVDCIVAISESSRQDAVALLGIDPARIHVVHLGVDHERFSPGQGRGPFAGGPPYFVHLGGRNENKNQARLLAAFARIAGDQPELQLYFAGPWAPIDHDWLRAETTRLGLQGRVKHIGYVPDADLSSLYGNSLGFVFPSLEEGFGLPVLEAMASGAAVITSDRSSLPEVAGDAALLVDPTDPEAIAAAMTVLLGDSGRADGLRAAGLARAAQFTWQETARQTLKVIGLTSITRH